MSRKFQGGRLVLDPARKKPTTIVFNGKGVSVNKEELEIGKNSKMSVLIFQCRTHVKRSIYCIRIWIYLLFYFELKKNLLATIKLESVGPNEIKSITLNDIFTSFDDFFLMLLRIISIIKQR